MSTRNLFDKDANATLSIQSVCEEFKLKVFIKKEEEIKRIITTTINSIIDRARKINAKTILSIHKDIIAIKKQFDLVIFKIKIENKNRILKKNNF